MAQLKILVIDDEKIICSGCDMILSDIGHSVDTCQTCGEGLGAIQTGAYHLVLLDMKLPDADGMEVLEAVRKQSSAPYVIVMTGYSTIQNAVAAMRLGAFDYLPKPFTDEELTDCVKRAEEKGAGNRGMALT